MTTSSGWPLLGSRQLLGWVHDNAAALRITDLSMRYVDEGAPLTAAEQAEFGEDAWRGSVELEYRYDGFDKAPARMETSAVFVPTPDGVRIASFGDAESRTPLWLADRLSVVRTPETMLAVAGDSAGRYAGLMRARRTPGAARAAEVAWSPARGGAELEPRSSTPRCRPSRGSTTTSRR